MPSFAQQLIADCLIAQGLPAPEADRIAELALGVAVAADLIQPARLDAWEQDARIYHLRGQRVTAVALAVRFMLNRATIFEAIRRHQRRRRAALGKAS